MWSNMRCSYLSMSDVSATPVSGGGGGTALAGTTPMPVATRPSVKSAPSARLRCPTPKVYGVPSTLGGPNVGTVDLAMATTKPPSSRRTARTRKPATSTRRSAASKRPSSLGRVRKSLATHLGRQSDDVWGLLLVAFGVVGALGIYADLTGPVGRFLRDLAGLLFGWGRLALPVAIAGVGVALLQGRPRQEPARVVIGTTFLVLAGSGLIHLANGT